MAEGLDVVVQKADAAAPDGGDNHQDDIYVVELAHQQDRHKYRHQNDKTAHCGCALLRELTLKTQVTNLLANLMTLQEADDCATEENRNQQGDDDCRRRAERYILEHTRTRQVKTLVQQTKK